MKRAALERKKTISRWKQHNKLIHRGEPTKCICDKQIGRFRKGQKVAGCGKPRCYICHYEKLRKIPNRRKKRQDINYMEQILEVSKST